MDFDILKKNKEYEKRTPCNFCDRWCERCVIETKKRCKLFLEEFDRRITNIAHGREPDDLRILEEDFKKTKSIDSYFSDFLQENLDLENIEEDERRKNKEEELINHPLQRIAERYRIKTHDFLKEIFYGKADVPGDLQYDFETVAWYHTLLSVKMHRALCDLFADGDDVALCDAASQLAICKKAIEQSRNALKSIHEKTKGFKERISYLLDHLHYINRQINLRWGQVSY